MGIYENSVGLCSKISGGSRISQRTGVNSKGGVPTYTLFGQFFLKTCLKMKEIGPRRGSVPGALGICQWKWVQLAQWMISLKFTLPTKNVMPSLGGLEPPTFRLTAERANRLRHRDRCAHTTEINKFENSSAWTLKPAKFFKNLFDYIINVQ